MVKIKLGCWSLDATVAIFFEFFEYEIMRTETKKSFIKLFIDNLCFVVLCCALLNDYFYSFLEGSPMYMEASLNQTSA